MREGDCQRRANQGDAYVSISVHGREQVHGHGHGDVDQYFIIEIGGMWSAISQYNTVYDSSLAPLIWQVSRSRIAIYGAMYAKLAWARSRRQVSI